MAYLGSGMEEVEKTVATVNMVCDTMTGDGSTATMTIGASQEMPGHVNNVSIYFDGVAQRPTTDYTLSGKTVTFSTAPEASVNVVCLSYASEYLDVISDATVYGAEILDGALTDAKIANAISSSKLTGTLPAIDGSAVTNYGPRAVTKSASDPVITTNPANGVGTVWANTTSGEMYVCTDATTDANAWINIGPGVGGYGKAFGGLGGGTVSGYISGGYGPTASNVIEKFSLTSNGNVTSVGTLGTKSYDGANASSATHGYVAGGNDSSGLAATVVIQKYTFSVDANSTGVGSLTTANDSPGGHSTKTHGYSVAGRKQPGAVTAASIEKYSFSADGNATNVGNITKPRNVVTTSSSATHGYTSGGYYPSAVNIIDRYSFASNSDTADVGDMVVANAYQSGQSSNTNGYTSGGTYTAGTNVIQKFSFTSDGNSVDVANLFVARYAPSSGISSTTHGYSCGGAHAPSNTWSDVIDKFEFSSDSDATDVGNLSTLRRYGNGSQS